MGVYNDITSEAGPKKDFISFLGRGLGGYFFIAQSDIFWGISQIFVVLKPLYGSLFSIITFIYDINKHKQHCGEV